VAGKSADQPHRVGTAALHDLGVKPVIYACGDRAEPSAGSSEVARCYAAGAPSSMSEVTAAACSATSQALLRALSVGARDLAPLLGYTFGQGW
jgi:hypothetical protein